MNMTLWVFQVLLAVHTFIGAGWKLSNSEQAVPSLQAIPHAFWIALIPFELLCVLGLVAPALRKQLGRFVPIAAAGIAAEMLLFCAVSLASGAQQIGELTYWLVVAATCAFIAYGRRTLAPL